MQTLENTSQGFHDADTSLPDLPVPADPRKFWRESGLEGRDAAECWDDLRQILLMQGAPYSSRSAETIPGQRETDRWLELSQPLTGVAGSELACDA